MKASAVAHARSQDRPGLESYDSGEEFSLHHWIEGCRIVHEEDAQLNDEGCPSLEEMEKVLKATLSEVESSPAYQHFTRNVIG